MQNRIYDARKDELDKRDHLAAPAAIVLPSNTSLRPYLGPVKDQGQLGSCTAHAGTGLREFLYRRFFEYEVHKPVQGNVVRFSPLFLYAIEREIEGDFTDDGGAQSRTIFKALSSAGCCLETDWPYVESKLREYPPASAVQAAESFKRISYHRVLDISTLKSVLASGYVATLGTLVYPSFESDAVAATGNVPVPGAHETPVGGHEMLVTGYSDAKQALDVRNSWGADWGDGGHCWIPYAYFNAPGVGEQTDFWTAHLGKPWL